MSNLDENVENNLNSIAVQEAGSWINLKKLCLKNSGSTKISVQSSSEPVKKKRAYPIVDIVDITDVMVLPLTKILPGIAYHDTEVLNVV